MNFVIEQQGQFSADIAILKEQQAEQLRLIAANTDSIRKLVDGALSLTHHGEETDRRIRELAQAQTHSNGRPDALIETVDKLVRRNVAG